MQISERVKQVPPSGIRKFFELVIGMDDVISLGVGEPDFVTPWHIREASMAALEQGYTMYTSNYGLLELREEISKRLESGYKVHYNPEDQVLVTVGVSEGFDLALRAIINPGDEVLVPEPSYVSYKPCTIFAGGVPVPVPTTVDEEFKVTPEKIKKRITERTKALILSYPSNPTGAIMKRKELEEVADIVNEYDLMVVTDEIYDELTYDGRHTTFVSLNGMKDRTVYLNGFSKAYAMTGWRIGYAAGNSEVIEAMMKIHQYSMLCAPVIGQKAAIEALRYGRDSMNEMIRNYNQRRRYVVKRLNEIGLKCFEPKGAFYAFPSIESTGLSSEEFSRGLLDSQKVAVVPGNAFGDSGEGFLRIAYAASFEDLEEATDRIEAYLKEI